MRQLWRVYVYFKTIIMKTYVFFSGKNLRIKVSIDAETILEAIKEIKKDYPNAIFNTIRLKSRRGRTKMAKQL